MVEFTDLLCLDLLLWLGRGQDVAQRLDINQSTVSRKATAAAKKLDMHLQRNSYGWELLGDPLLVRMERQVHQTRRLMKNSDIRLDADPWLGPVLLGSTPRFDTWITGRYHHLSHHQPLHLLRERVLDGWLTVLSNEIGNNYGPDLTIIKLGSMPIQLTATHTHPLSGERGISLGDLLRFPRLNLPSGVVPVLESTIRDHGLWDSPVIAHSYSPEDWDDRAPSEVTLLYGHPLLHTMKPNLVPLDFDLKATYPIALVLHRELAAHPATETLIASLVQKLEVLQLQQPLLSLETCA